jgi:hypothetical protein
MHLPLRCRLLVAGVVLACLAAGACSPGASTPAPSATFRPTPTTTPTPIHTPTPTPLPTVTPHPTATREPPTPTEMPTQPAPTATPTVTVSAALSPTLSVEALQPSFDPLPPAGRAFATLEEFWAGTAEWVLEVYDVGLPVGESDTVYRGGSEFWSYLHASHQSAGVVDQCGDPAPFPGCVTLWKSTDGGLHFTLENPLCLFPCAACPCDPQRDHTDQQQYPRVFFERERAYMVYEWGAGTFLRTSRDGLTWSAEAHVPGTGVWHTAQGSCSAAEAVGDHPHIYRHLEWDCLVGAPPGIYVEGDLLYVFVGLGRAPGHMGCFVGPKARGAAGLRKCASNPLFGAENGYGPVEVLGAAANPYFEFRTISSADVVRVGDHYYMAYEGVRGPSDPTVVDNQFGLGFARSVGPAIDGPWEKYPGNPVIMDLANNWGIGHADLVIVGPATYMYTATSQATRGRYVLVRR